MPIHQEVALTWQREKNGHQWVGSKEFPLAQVQPVWDYASSSSRPTHWTARAGDRALGRFPGVRQAKAAATAAVRVNPVNVTALVVSAPAMSPEQRKALQGDRRVALLKYVYAQYDDKWLNADRLAKGLSVESLPYDQLPFHLRAALVEFRKLRQDSRVAACRVFLRSAFLRDVTFYG